MGHILVIVAWHICLSTTTNIYPKYKQVYILVVVARHILIIVVGHILVIVVGHKLVIVGEIEDDAIWCASSKPIWAVGQIEFVGEDWRSGLVNSRTQNPTPTVSTAAGKLLNIFNQVQSICSTQKTIQMLINFGKKDIFFRK